MPLLESRSVRFPFMALLLSGGHCLISICKRFNEFHLLGHALDEAPGDTLDKVARRCRLKNLGPPFDEMSGGAALELLSQRPNANRFKHFSASENIPMLAIQNCDLSFSGYRGSFDKLTAEIDALWEQGNREKLLDELGSIAGSLQRAMMVQVIKKLQRAIAYYRMHWRHNNPDAFVHSPMGSGGEKEWLPFKCRTSDDNEYLDLVISGGVAANRYFVSTIEQVCKQDFDESINVYAPSKGLCSDNGLMIAWNGMLRYLDYLNNASTGDRETGALDEGVIVDQAEMDLVAARPVWPIGLDIRKQVGLADFRLIRLRNPELKLNCS